MRFTTTLLSLLGISGLALSAALPAPVATEGGAQVENRLLYEDDIILFGNGHHQVMKKRDYEALKRQSYAPYKNISSVPETPFPKRSAHTQHASANEDGLTRRDCEQSSEVQVASTTNFAQWDVPMSSVVTAEDAVASVIVTSGFSLANSVSTTVEVDITEIENFLETDFSISFSTTWTTTTSIAYTFVVAEGKSGLVVSNPETTRYTGKYIYGCTDSPQTTDFTSDTYKSATLNGLEWVEGNIHLCSSDSYPVPYCIGTGTHN